MYLLADNKTLWFRYLFIYLFYLFKNFTVTLKCKLKEKLINDNSRNRKVSRQCTNRYLQCKHGAVQPVQAVNSRTIASIQKRM